jgi:hypothetical protein
MQWLAALVPRPRLHLIRFGVRVTSLREVSGPPLVVPQPPPAQTQTSAEAADTVACEAETVQAWPHRISWTRLPKRVLAAT